MNSILRDETFQSFTLVASAVLCLCAASFGYTRNSPLRQTIAVSLIASGLILLAVLEYAGIQTLAINEGRQIARSEGWYQDRREYQKVAILGFLGAGALVALSLAAYFQWRPSIIFSALLFAFILVRAISLHQVDSLLYRHSIAGLQFNGLIQSGLPVLIGFTALIEAWHWPFSASAAQDPCADIPESD